MNEKKPDTSQPEQPQPSPIDILVKVAAHLVATYDDVMEAGAHGRPHPCGKYQQIDEKIQVVSRAPRPKIALVGIAVSPEAALDAKRALEALGVQIVKQGPTQGH